MAGKVLELSDLLVPDRLATGISDMYLEWETYKSARYTMWKEVTEYIFATDTTMTSNSKLPWSNKTTIPKLCQIRDNLHANYMNALFPKRKWLIWESDDEASNAPAKVEATESYMRWVTEFTWYYNTVSRLIYDYIDYGNAFVMPEWVDETHRTEDDREQTGYVGPKLRRISPLDIVFNPAAPDFESSPKIIRSIITLGEVKDMLMQSSGHTPEEQAAAQATYEYLRTIRQKVSEFTGAIMNKDRIYDIAGFGDYREYLGSNNVEVLTFYGDIYDFDTDTLLKNHIIKIVDRHKVVYKQPNPSIFSHAPIYHAGWRLRPDNLWAMGPLDNLVGMQYRIDHLENMKADVFDLTAYPPLKIKGYVEDFDWAPMERIYIGDDGDVALMSPDVNALQADTEIAILEQKMEEMAGSPREAMGFRSPGEKTKYEVQSLENAASRIFQNKITHFERHLIEPSLNGMLELARRNVTKQTIRVFDDELKFADFLELTIHDITGNGRIRPVAARHFAEQANMVQNLTSFLGSPAGQDPGTKIHFSGLKLARLWENLLELEDFKIVEPYIALTEQADAQRLSQTQGEQLVMESQTPTGIMEGDFDPEEAQVLASNPMGSEGI